MSVGTGIFLGLVCLAAAYLYTQTKYRWRWRTIAKYTGLIAAIPLVAGLVWVGYATLSDYLEARPKRVETYADISLGDAKRDVLYAKGTPMYVVEVNPQYPGLQFLTETSDLPSGKQVSDYQVWAYDEPETGPVEVEFSPETQRVVGVFCYAEVARTCPPLIGVSAGATEEDVVHQLGAPSDIELSGSPQAVKTLRFRQWNVAFLLQKRRVYGLRLGRGPELAARQAEALPKVSHHQGPKPPAECSSAKTAEECARILQNAGKNPFDAYGHVGSEPVYGEPVYDGQTGMPTPCKNGEATCKPWEREWGETDPPPGTVVTD